jgi:hypothetical protein
MFADSNGGLVEPARWLSERCCWRETCVWKSTCFASFLLFMLLVPQWFGMVYTRSISIICFVFVGRMGAFHLLVYDD